MGVPKLIWNGSGREMNEIVDINVWHSKNSSSFFGLLRMFNNRPAF